MQISILVGTLDKTAPISISKKWSKILTKSNYKEIQGAGHLVHEEMPHAISQLILEQLKAPQL
jgi:pimeloyl-ACP methyl ester carboxylesterase